MADALERWTYNDWSTEYVAKVETYHLGINLMNECLEQGYMLEPMNAPAYYQFVKQLEQLNLFPHMHWEFYERKLKEERVMFYNALHRNAADTTIVMGLTDDFYMSTAHNSWILHMFSWNKFREVKVRELTIADKHLKTECKFYYSAKAKLLDLLQTKSDVMFREIDFEDGVVYRSLSGCRQFEANAFSVADSLLGICGIPGYGTKELIKILKKYSALQSFDDLVQICNQVLKETAKDNITRIAQSIYEAWFAYVITWYAVNHNKIFCECYWEAIVETRNNYFLGHYYKAASDNYRKWEEKFLSDNA